MNKPLVENWLAKIDQTISEGIFTPDIESLEKVEVPDWYVNGKFGIFIHWGLYSVPAYGSEWYPRFMYLKDSPVFEHHLKTYGHPKDYPYKEFIKDFKAERFDASQWADLFKNAGARFVVPVAEHHDGFALYQTELNRWNAAAMGPKRDVVGELADAVRAHGMTFGLSNHRAEHYWFCDGALDPEFEMGDLSSDDFYGPLRKGPSEHHRYHECPPPKSFLDDWLARNCELVDKYKPELVWFDWWVNQMEFRPYLRKFAAYAYNYAKAHDLGIAINYKINALSPASAVFDIERGQLDEIYPQFWQNDTSVSKNSWGYIDNHDYKQAHDIIADLVDVVSKNGALLLNVGPKADGTIPQPEIDMLLEIGKWLEINGEAIYETRPWTTYGEGPTRIPKGGFTDTKRKPFTSADIRFTSKPDCVYAIPLAQPEDGVIKIRSFASGHDHCPPNIQSVELLGAGLVEWIQNRDALTVQLPEPKLSSIPCVLKFHSSW